MINGELFSVSNGLQVRVDWLSFTVTDYMEVCDVVELMGYHESDFVVLPKGAHGYRCLHRLPGYPVSVLSDGRDDMGIHVDISGSALADVLQHFRALHSEDTPFGEAYNMEELNSTVFTDFLRMVDRIGTVTRLDLAVDDIGCNFFSVLDVKSIVEDRRFVSKFRAWDFYTGNMCTGERTGETLYLGKRSSEILLRVYNKRMEQNKKLSATGKPLLDYEWIRWELELKGDRAVKASRLLISGDSVGSVTLGVLGNYLRIIIPDKDRLSRCSTDPLWAEFLAGIEKQELYCPAEPKTLEDMKDHLKKQYAPTLATIVACDLGSTDFINDMLYDGMNRLNNRQKALIHASVGGVD